MGTHPRTRSLRSVLLAAGWILAALAASYVLIAHRAHAKFADRHGTSKHKPALPLYTADDASALYHRFMQEHRLSASECDLMCRAATLVNTRDESKALSAATGPMIIASASGMATGGRGVHHLKAFIGDERNLVLLAGFQAPGTCDGALANEARTLRIHGEDFPVRQLQSVSSHADASKMLAWMSTLTEAPRRTFITHGERGASDALRQRIERELGWAALVPEHLQSFDLALSW